MSDFALTLDALASNVGSTPEESGSLPTEAGALIAALQAYVNKLKGEAAAAEVQAKNATSAREAVVDGRTEELNKTRDNLKLALKDDNSDEVAAISTNVGLAAALASEINAAEDKAEAEDEAAAARAKLAVDVAALKDALDAALNRGALTRDEHKSAMTAADAAAEKGGVAPSTSRTPISGGKTGVRGMDALLNDTGSSS